MILTDNSAGGFDFFNSSPIVRNCTVKRSGNFGMYAWGTASAPTVIGCSFIENDWFGVDCVSCDPTIVNCLFKRNGGDFGGGGIQVYDSEAVVVNCTIVENRAGYAGGGIGGYNSTPTIANCIIRGNTPDEVWSTGATVSFCNVQGGYGGPGNIDAEPMFVQPSMDDYRVQPGSPCIDAGDSSALPEGVAEDISGDPRFVDDPNTQDTGIGNPCVDIGAFEFQVETACPEDVNEDRVVDINDLFEILGHWGDGPGAYDVNEDNVVDGGDLVAVMDAWGPCS